MNFVNSAFLVVLSAMIAIAMPGLMLAQGVDDETWLFHLRRGDYTRWFRDAIKDNDLAEEVESLETSEDPMQSRESLSASAWYAGELPVGTSA